MKLSIIICASTIDQWSTLTETVNSCFSQTQSPDEIILVVDYNEELRERVNTEIARVHVIDNVMAKGLSGARNSGVLASSGDILVFLTDDTHVEQGWLEKLTKPFDDPLIAGCGGWVNPRWEAQEPLWFPRSFLWALGCSYAGLPLGGGAIRSPLGANMALRRGVFNLVGGFSEGLGRIGSTTLGCEETELCIRYNIRRPEDSFVLVRDAVVFLQVPEFRFTWNYFLRRCWSEGLSKAALASLVGQNAGLSAERRHIAIALPLEVFSSLRQLVVDPINATKRITCVIVGALVTMAGFLRGTRVVRRSPISVKNTNLHPERETSSVQVSDEWRPISIVQVDVDLLPNELRISDGANNRVWVETTRQGQVIGRQIIWAQNGKVLFEDLEEVTRRYKSRECSFVVMADDLLPPISVVIPTICRFPDVLNRLVASLALMDYPKFEIIVVDNRVMPATDMPDFGSYKNVKVVAERIPGASAARNRGIQESSYEIVAFTDDDVLVDQRWLRAIGGRLVNNPEISAIGGLVLPAQLETLPQLWFEEYFGGFSQSFDLKIVSTKDHPNDSLFPYAPGAYVAGCNMAFRKSTLQALGGFRLALGPGTVALGGEDLEIFVAIASSGATVAFEPAALIRHLHRQTEEEFMLQVKGYGLGLTAMYMSLVLHNPWHLVGMLRHAWQGTHSLKKSRTRRSPSLETTYPEFTSLIERRGMLQGPLVYLKSWTTFRLAKDEISKQFGNSVRM